MQHFSKNRKKKLGMSSVAGSEQPQLPTDRTVVTSDRKSATSLENNGYRGGNGVEGSKSPTKSRSKKPLLVDDVEKAEAAPALKPRTSRWADEVDEDDQFMPTRRAAPESRRTVPTKVEKPEVDTAQRTRPATSHGRRYEDRGYGKRDEEPRSDRRRGGKGVEMRSREKPVTVRIETPKSAPSRPSKEDLEEIARMKEVMARKAEERKRLKEEEEARLESERRARCEAKLREIEEKKRSRASSTVVTHDSDETKKDAFNNARRELRSQREKDRKGDERLEILIPNSSSSAAPILSPNAKEFIPTAPVMPMHHWSPYHPHPGAPHHMQGHHMPPMVQPGMLPPHGPVGHMPPQMQTPQMGFGYPQYPPHFAPYGYPHPPPQGSHQMANHYY